jgi:hypothetical protein
LNLADRLQRLELANERIHATLAIVDDLRFLEDPRGLVVRHNHDAVLVGDDDVTRTDGYAHALDRDVRGDGGVMADGST